MNDTRRKWKENGISQEKYRIYNTMMKCERSVDGRQEVVKLKYRYPDGGYSLDKIRLYVASVDFT